MVLGKTPIECWGVMVIVRASKHHCRKFSTRVIASSQFQIKTSYTLCTHPIILANVRIHFSGNKQVVLSNFWPPISYLRKPIKMAAITMVKVNNAPPL